MSSILPYYDVPPLFLVRAPPPQIFQGSCACPAHVRIEAGRFVNASAWPCNGWHCCLSAALTFAGSSGGVTSWWREHLVLRNAIWSCHRAFPSVPQAWSISRFDTRRAIKAAGIASLSVLLEQNREIHQFPSKRCRVQKTARTEATSSLFNLRHQSTLERLSSKAR